MIVEQRPVYLVVTCSTKRSGGVIPIYWAKNFPIEQEKQGCLLRRDDAHKRREKVKERSIKKKVLLLATLCTMKNKHTLMRNHRAISSLICRERKIVFVKQGRKRKRSKGKQWREDTLSKVPLVLESQVHWTRNSGMFQTSRDGKINT